MHARALPFAYRCPRSTADFVRSSAGVAWCPSCRERVHDLAELGEAATQRVLAERAGTTICVRYRVDAEGRVCFDPPPLAASRLVRRPLARRVVGRLHPRVHSLALAGLAAGVLAGCVGPAMTPTPLVPPDDAWSSSSDTPHYEASMGVVILIESATKHDLADSLLDTLDEREIVPDEVRPPR